LFALLLLFAFAVCLIFSSSSFCSSSSSASVVAPFLGAILVLVRVLQPLELAKLSAAQLFFCLCFLFKQSTECPFMAQIRRA